MTNYNGQAVLLTKTFGICIYEPESDMHFPISPSQIDQFRIVGWEILSADIGERTRYVVMIATNNNDLSLDKILINVGFSSQFGNIIVKSSSCQDLDECDEKLKVAVCKIVLKSLSRQKGDLILPLLNSISKGIQREFAHFPVIPAFKIKDHENSIRLEGVHEITHGIPIQKEFYKLLFVTDISYDCTNKITTTLSFDGAVHAGDFIVVGDGQYGFVNIK